ncbi:hypothetical protein HPB52_009113 [Rhipicephalus sanguineus]|uniref:Fatty acyl-CoA reductase n=1 Tax=Rhipicephalus sanguineus TaxID=34632 RepID=A0A9D4T1Y8_RHISA|nr:hypothetical protein HPB52_009113 [Rhipicephalus sanguineus]
MWHDVNLWCLHYLPARVVDLALNLYGQKPRFVCHYKKIRKTIDSVRYFQTHEWLFRSNNVSKLLQELSPTDARLFNIDVQRLDWRSYFEGYVLGIRRYLLKAEDSELPEARKRLKRLSNEEVTDPENGYLYGHPNTYTLTKSVAESLLLEERGDIPAVIVRPSIVTASNREPLPGWVDNYNGCTGIIVVLGLGLLQSILAEKKCVGDVIPVDVVANMLICAAWHTAEKRPKDVEVYHCTSGSLTRRTWAYLTAGIQREICRLPLPNAIRFPKFQVTNSQMWHNVNLWCLHYLPALVVDLALQLHGQKPRFVRHYQKIRKAINSLQYFQTHEWLFRSNNALRLLQELSPTDAQLFDFDVRRLEWRSYFESYVLGIRKYLLKAEDSELPEARKRIKRLNAVRWSLYLGLAVIPWGLVAKVPTWDTYSSVRGFATALCDMVGF